jgi:DNA recombination protein RmuC
MSEFILLGVGVVLCFVLVITIQSLKKSFSSDTMIQAIREGLSKEFQDNRSELNAALALNRKENADALDRLSKNLQDILDKIQEGMVRSSKENREELKMALKEFQENFSKNMKEFTDAQGQKFDSMATKQDELVKTTELKLEKMRETVDEKLHKTLEDRLGQSFKLVSERLEAVQKGLGEMQTLANGVGDLKKVLNNVKTRGVLGEYQLGNILEQILAPEQYEANVKTKKDSNDLVEFAIKLPGKDDDGAQVYLPVDAKFPQDDYVRLQEAFDSGDVAGIDVATKSLMNSIKKFAKDIHEKYVDPPHTTDISILFLPVEGLYAEVVRHPQMVSDLQRDYKVIITGPSTLAAILNSFAMGFRTLAIQKRSSEVWKVLRAVKTEFSKFGGVLEKAQKKLNEANKELDNLVGTRTKMMLSKLKRVEELPGPEANTLLEEGSDLSGYMEIEEGDDSTD